MSDQIFWFATRSAGIMAWFAATLSVLIGLMLSSRVLGRRPTIPWLLDLHRFFGSLSIFFLAMHIITLLADPFIEFGPADILIPGVAEVAGLTPMSLALGVVAGWILVVVELSSLIKNHLPKEFWHTLHLTSFGTVVTGAMHGVQAGSEANNRVLVAAAVSVLMATALVGLTRITRSFGNRRYRREVGVRATARAGNRVPAAVAPGPRRAGSRPGGSRPGGSRPAGSRPAGSKPATGQVPAVAKAPATRREATKSAPAWATGEQPVVTQSEATWNNGQSDWDWNETLRSDGPWNFDDTGSGRDLTSNPGPARRRQPEPQYRTDPVPRYPAESGYEPADRYEAQPQYRPDPVPRYEPEPVWTTQDQPQLKPRPAWDEGPEPAPTPADSVSGRWALYGAAAGEADDGTGIDEFPGPGEHTGETKMSYDEAKRALRGRTQAPPRSR